MSVKREPLSPVLPESFLLLLLEHAVSVTAITSDAAVTASLDAGPERLGVDIGTSSPRVLCVELECGQTDSIGACRGSANYTWFIEIPMSN
jgi:hypothetical protein